MSLVEALGIDADYVPRIATAFGGGLAGRGETCGALIGGAMALGLKYGRDNADDINAKAATQEKVSRLLSEFQSEFNAIRCIDLTGCNMLTAEGMARAKELDLHGTVCPKYVAFTAEKAAILTEL